MDSAKIKGIQTFKVIKKDGTIRKQWQENVIGSFIRKFFNVDIQNFFLFGKYRDSVSYQNTVTNNGLAGVASLIIGEGSVDAFTYLALGTGTTAPTVNNTALQSEITDSGLARAIAIPTRVTTTITNDTAQLSLTWEATASKAITECGAFSGAISGVMLGRQTFSAINLVSGDAIQVNYQFQVT